MAQGVVSQTERDHLTRIDRDKWPGELYLEEFQPMLRRLTTSPEDTAAQRALLHGDFLGVAPKRRPAATRVREGDLQVERFRYEDASPEGPEAFLGQMARYAGELEKVEQREVHVRRVEVRKDKGSAGPVVDVDFETFLAGAAGGQRRSDRAVWRATVERQADGAWQTRSLSLQTLEVARSDRVFTDVTGLLPDSYRMTDPKTNKYTDFPASNGITLADWDGDGDLDIHLFRPYLPGLFYENDGTGRFSERAPKGLEERGDRIESMSGTAYFFDADNDGDLDFIRLQNR
jgi:hypothetical protein